MIENSKDSALIISKDWMVLLSVAFMFSPFQVIIDETGSNIVLIC